RFLVEGHQDEVFAAIGIVVAVAADDFFELVEEAGRVVVDVRVEETLDGVLGEAGGREAVFVAGDDLDAAAAEAAGGGQRVPTAGEGEEGFHGERLEAGGWRLEEDCVVS